MNGELNLGGVFIPPLLAFSFLAALPFALLRKVFLLTGLYRLVWHRALFDIALYVVLVGLFDLLSAPLS